MEPLFFVPFFEEKPWGGERLSSLYAKYPAGINIGASWELSPVIYRQTFVRGGAYAGWMLSELYKKQRALFGTNTPYFPFVIKLMDMNGAGPVSVHGGGMKSDAAQIEGIYVIEARRGANIVSGTTLSNNLELFESIAHNTIADSFRYLDVAARDAFLIPPGIPHALGDGLLVYSIATPLLETSNIYDWGRYGELNIDKVIDSFRYNSFVCAAERTVVGEGREIILGNELFRLERIDATVPVTECAGAYFCVYTAFAQGRVDYAGRSKRFAAGDTFLIPADFGAYTITGGVLLKAVPQPSIRN